MRKNFLTHSFFLLVSVLVMAIATVPAESLSSLTEEEMADVTGQGGVLIDFEQLEVTMDDITYTDRDGNGTGSTGQVILGSGTDGVVIDNGGSPTSLTGLTVDAVGALTIGGVTQGGIRAEMPNGTVDLSIDEVNLSTNTTFQTNINGLDISNTSVEIGAN